MKCGRHVIIVRRPCVKVCMVVMRRIMRMMHGEKKGDGDECVMNRNITPFYPSRIPDLMLRWITAVVPGRYFGL
jgi:hypothetical protein